MPHARSTTASLVAKASTGSGSGTGDELKAFGREVERLMCLPDVPQRQERLVAGGLLELGRLAATIDAPRGLDKPTNLHTKPGMRSMPVGYQWWTALPWGDMLSSNWEAGPLKRCNAARGTSKARVIPKNSQKCALFFACVGLNDADGRKPPKFHLPQVEQVTRLMATAGPKAFSGKFDVSNCFWSIRMPYRWCRVFRVNTPQGCFRWLTLPFGWKYSPVLCKRLVSALVCRALRDLRARGITYLDDVLVYVVGRKRVRVAARRMG